jgi:Phosphoesterase family
MSGVLAEALAAPANNATGSIKDVEHVVILMQENRSLDHYFGTMRGVRGFGVDPQPAGVAIVIGDLKLDYTVGLVRRAAVALSPIHAGVTAASPRCRRSVFPSAVDICPNHPSVLECSGVAGR